MSLLDRIERLERGGGDYCAACGLGPDSSVEYVLSGDLLEDASDEGPVEGTPPCPRCGQQEVFIVPWPLPPSLSGEETSDKLDRLEAEREAYLEARPWIRRGDAQEEIPDDLPPWDRGRGA